MRARGPAVHPSPGRPATAVRRDLERWLPSLLQVWRSFSKRRPGPPLTLTSPELHEVARSVRQLSAGLTRERGLIGQDYLSDPAMLGAYLLYFWPISFLQTRLALGEVHGQNGLVRILDAGSGPGPVGLAAASLFKQASLLFLDRNRPALELARRLAAAAGLPSEIRVWDPQTPDPLPHGPFDLITAGHLVNELWRDAPDRLERRARLAASLADRLGPRGRLLILEPALTQTSRDLLAVRDRLLGQGLGLQGPCLRQGPCPVLETPGATCHTEIPEHLPGWVQALANMAGFKKEKLKMTYLLFQPGLPGQVRGEDEFLIVSDPMLSKNGRIRRLACGPAGRLSLAIKPSAATDANRVFLQLKRGDHIRVTGAGPRPGGLDILPGTSVVLARSRPLNILK